MNKPKQTCGVDTAEISETVRYFKMFDAFIAECTCGHCGSAPDPFTIQMDVALSSRGGWFLVGFACEACRRITVAKMEFIL